MLHNIKVEICTKDKNVQMIRGPESPCNQKHVKTGKTWSQFRSAMDGRSHFTGHKNGFTTSYG
jgi:hypothetical protein